MLFLNRLSDLATVAREGGKEGEIHEGVLIIIVIIIIIITKKKILWKKKYQALVSCKTEV